MYARIVAIVFVLTLGLAHAAELRVGTFNVDATPPVGSALAGGGVPPMRGIDDPLSARGVVIIPEGEDPVVLCAVDWIGIANGGHGQWRGYIAAACGTSPDRVMVHTLHQHDAPFYDTTVERLMEEHDIGGRIFDPDACRAIAESAAEAAATATKNAQPITHVSWAAAKVDKVASNRRIIGEDGKVRATRWTATTNPELRAEPEGTIDPMLKAVAFWNGDERVAVLTYYATHPQSFYRTGKVSADFPGLARNAREEATGTPHIHFNGAGGNITAGKYNDGSPKNRPVLVGRMADGMDRALAGGEKKPIGELDWNWSVTKTPLPVRSAVTIEGERARLADESLDLMERKRAARELAWLQLRAEDNAITDIGCLKLGPIQILHMPGELFIEYQLAAQAMAPDDFVCMAAYGDYAPGYIGTAIAYEQGGYEAQVYTSRTDPEVEEVLMNAMRTALGHP